MCHHERDGVRGFGVAQATKNCDLLCVPESADRLLDLLCEKNFAGVLPRYRGHLSPPLDQRWLRGGWTSHFVWKTGDAEAYLDVFGPAPRASSPWEAELHGLYAGPHTVAEMKRTDRGKDWPFATALGVKLLEAGDPRGWLHLFDYEVLIQMVERVPCPAGLIAQRPVLGLLVARDERLEVALKAEIEFWQRLDHLRLRVYERAVRSYMLAVKKDDRADAPDLRTQHRARVEPAEPAAVESAARPRRGPTGDRSPRGGRPRLPRPRLWRGDGARELSAAGATPTIHR
ncbi:MAG: hypothetical protein MUF81_12700 [Verrucomicrobia bacterium]|nr:hypothetical protein [Verrucomicrobiota bacterium]